MTTTIKILAIAYEGEPACASGRREPSDCAYITRPLDDGETESDAMDLPSTVAVYDGVVEARWPLAEALEAVRASCVRCCESGGCGCNAVEDDDAEYLDRVAFERAHAPGAAA